MSVTDRFPPSLDTEPKNCYQLPEKVLPEIWNPRAWVWIETGEGLCHTSRTVILLTNWRGDGGGHLIRVQDSTLMMLLSTQSEL